jgi:hypothetical protein
VEFSSRPLAAVRLAAARPGLALTLAAALPRLPAALPRLAALLGGIPAGVLIGRPLPVAGSEHDLELVQLVPLLVGSLALGNGQERLQAGTGGIIRLLFIHGGIISLLGHGRRKMAVPRDCERK